MSKHETYRSQEPLTTADPLTGLFLSMLKAAQWDAVYGGHFDHEGRPLIVAYSARKWLSETTGCRRFPILSADYCLHASEDEIRWRVSRQAHRRFKSTEEYRAFLLETIHTNWLWRRLRACEEQTGQLTLLKGEHSVQPTTGGKRELSEGVQGGGRGSDQGDVCHQVR